MTNIGRSSLTADFWAAFATMLVVLPSSVAFGVTIYAPLGNSYAMMGALAGILGATALGFVAAVFGATDRLMTTPSAPATAVLAAFALSSVHQGSSPEMVILLMTMMGVLTGFFQILIGFTRVGSLIKYIPHTVVSGYMTVVGLIIIISQLPSLLGVLHSGGFWQSVLHPQQWQFVSLVVGLVTVAGMIVSGQITQRVPSTIVGIFLGLLSYVLLSFWLPSLQTLSDNPFVLGALGVSLDGYLDTLTSRWQAIGGITLGQVAGLFGSALTLAAVLSIDTLKTAIVADQITNSSHEPNQELVAQGLANIASAGIGGVAGSGNMGATLVNINSGAQTRYSMLLVAVFTLLALLLFISVLAWLPKATLAAVLIVGGVRMIDLNALRLITSRTTAMDFGVVVVMVIVGLQFDLIMASAAGVALSIVLFLRAQVGNTAIHRKTFLNQRSSSWYRTECEVKTLEHYGTNTVIFELQGSLFFGVARELYNALAKEAQSRDYLIIDFLRVSSIDVTAAHVLAQVHGLLTKKGGRLVLCNLRDDDTSDMTGLLTQLCVVGETIDTKVLMTLDEAIEWVENKLLGHEEIDVATLPLLTVDDMELFQGRNEDTLVDLTASLVERKYVKGDKLYDVGDAGDALYLLRRGRVKIIAPIGGGRRLYHIATIGAGHFFGGLSFLDNHVRQDAAVADTDVDVYVLTRAAFNRLSTVHTRLGFVMLESIARSLGQRLRRSDGELTLLLE